MIFSSQLLIKKKDLLKVTVDDLIDGIEQEATDIYAAIVQPGDEDDYFRVVYSS